ncbi:MAG: acetate--CoA ligase family protein, partial [Alphaproteobacteria bacterium]|nr:acetate--CoA ligase family protein [Alphaproteobacteria bacterium]
MSIRNLEYLFKPKAIAVIGASPVPNSVGGVVAHNLFTAGFSGPIMPVNPRHQAVEGVLAYPDIASLPVAPDLGVICTPPETVPALIAELAARGARAAVVITSGLGVAASPRMVQNLRQEMLLAARPTLLRIVGPNCLGVIAPGAGVNASFAHTSTKPGWLAFVAQSGAIVTSVLGWAKRHGIGFSHLVSLGDMADVDLGDTLDYLASDPGTRAILMYIEVVSQARKFMSAARAAARSKPVIVVKAGRHVEGARAVASHTGALAGSEDVYDTMFRRAGILRVLGLEELFDAVEILGMTRVPAGDRLAILTNSGGIGALATDALIDEGGSLASLTQESILRLDQKLPPNWSHTNPVGIVADANGDRYAEAMGILLEDSNVDAILVLNCPNPLISSHDAARAVIAATAKKQDTTVLASWLGDGEVLEARRLFAENHIPFYGSPGQAVRAFMYLVNYRRNQQMLMETPPSVPENFTTDPSRARAVVAAALAEGREWLTEPEAKEILAAFSIPVVATRVAHTPEEAASIAADIGGSVAIKIISPNIPHKREVGGIALDVKGPAAAREAVIAITDQVGRLLPKARVDGFSVQPMVRRPGAYELIIGVLDDEQFGPVILFGHGGTAVEVLGDRALGLPPLNMQLAQDIMSRTRIYKLLQGYRGLPGARLDAIALTLIKVSQLVIDIAEVCELDINPLLADEYGVVALDARIKVRAAAGVATDRLAIRPYPKELEERIPLPDGRELLLRPVVPEDEPSFQQTFAKLTPEEIRLRFFVPMKTLSHMAAARFTQIDYDREMILILTEPGIPGRPEIFGLVSIAA